MTIAIHLFDIYRSANIGIFLKTNDHYCLVPRGLAETKRQRISSLLHSETIPISVASSRLLGPLVAMNNKGIVVSRLAEEEEVQTIQTATGLNVAKVPSRFTSVGNLIAANDRGAIISDVFGEESMKVIESTLQVPTEKVRISNYIQVGAMISATNSGALIHPTATESDVSKISSSLGVEPEPATINGGVPFVSSGFLGNTKAILVGNHTRGGELVIIGRAFSG